MEISEETYKECEKFLRTGTKAKLPRNMVYKIMDKFELGYHTATHIVWRYLGCPLSPEK